MSKATGNEKNIKEKLEYLNLDLENIPKFLLKYTNLDFRVSNGVEENIQVVYKHIPINKIQILVTSVDKDEELRLKYAKSVALCRYMNMEDTENIEKYTIFLNMVNSIDTNEIDEIEEIQKKLDKAIPFRINYQKSFLWNIFYAQTTDTYFMLVSAEDLKFNNMFFLLKKQIEFANSKKKIAPKIYVPVNHLEYSRDIFTKSEIKDIENYLWLLAGDWVNVYEVYDKKNKPSIHIIGTTSVYESIKTEYKLKVSSRNEAIDCYKLLKALFILKSELNYFYKFEIKINELSELEFYYNSEKLTLSSLPSFITKQYQIISDELLKKNLACNNMEKNLFRLKSHSVRLEREFLDKERQISTYLEYKKTFLGKIKIFFSGKKKKEIVYEEEKVEETSFVKDVLDQIVQTKSSYTIEDLVVLYSAFEKKAKMVKDLEMDIEAIELKNKNLEKKIENATLYIREIEKHKKSIFEFWKFANKDEIPSLAQGENRPVKKKMVKIFEYDMDFEDLGIKKDKLQRDLLTKDEMNSVFLAKTNILKGINISRKEELSVDDKKILKKILDELKQELSKAKEKGTDFDIFGSILEDRTQIKTIANKHHREIEKNKLQILNITKKTTIDEFIEMLMNIDENIRRAISKITSTYNMPVYKMLPAKEMPEGNLNVFSINIESSMKGNTEKQVNLYKLNLKEEMNVVFYSNIIFFDNSNNTLPIGMNLSEDVLVDLENSNLQLKKAETFYTNLYSQNSDETAKLNITTVNVFEYVEE